jgi:lysophospholipase L1-like esterase
MPAEGCGQPVTRAQWSSFVAVGDSFTEGMDDPHDDGRYRGWADLVAGCLAAEAEEFRYANLAVRGRLLRPVIDAQLPVAIAMRADLVSFVAGGNDVIRRRFHPAVVGDAYERAVARLTAAGSTVMLFTPSDLTLNYPGGKYLTPRIEFFLDLIHRVSKEYGTILIDLWGDDGFRDRRMWSVDRLHLNTLGHQRVAAKVLAELGLKCDPAWAEALPEAVAQPWMSARWDDLRWAREHLAPWIGRRLTGRSSGDTVTAKRPELIALAESVRILGRDSG